MSTPLLPEVVIEIDANPVSFTGGGERYVTVVVQWGFPVNIWGYHLC